MLSRRSLPPVLRREGASPRLRVHASGQSCIAAKRFLVEQTVLDRFRDAFVAAMEAQQVGDPREAPVALLAQLLSEGEGVLLVLSRTSR